VDQPALHSVSVAAAIIDDDGRVLVIERRDNRRLEPPGGVLELDETVEDGLRREVLEETGLTITVETLTGVYKNMVRGIIALVFRCRPAGGNPTITAEAATLHWLTRPEIETQLTEAYAVRLTDALDYAGAPALRAHDGVRPTASD
jgi:8-oxo-dGTP diphosphatase